MFALRFVSVDVCAFFLALFYILAALWPFVAALIPAIRVNVTLSTDLRQLLELVGHRWAALASFF